MPPADLSAIFVGALLGSALANFVYLGVLCWLVERGKPPCR